MSNPELRNLTLNSGFQDGLDLDVAIVGAGCSGLYTAYRLKTGETQEGQKFPQKVQIFEMSDRIAGRLESVKMPGMSISGELGGMRYLNSQKIVTTLIEEVFQADLTSIDFPMGDPDHLFFYLRKQRMKANCWTQAQAAGEKWATRYFLNDGDEGFSADQLFNKVIYDILMADPWFVQNYGSKVSHPDPYTYNFELTSQDWDNIKPVLTYTFPGPFQGQRLNDLGFWNVIKDQVSQEGFQFLADAGGYYSNTINWNAAEAFPYMVGDFSDATVQYKTIEGGYDQIAYALAYHYLQFEGSTIWTENTLLTFQHAEGPRRYELVFRNNPTGQLWKVYADCIVLGMPRRSLELLDQQSFLFQNPQMQYNMDSVIMEGSFKLLMGFDYPWWKQDFGAEAGHSVTDLPMRQCYYFGTDPDDSHSLFLATYNDMRTVTFWEPLDDLPERYVPQPTRLVSQEHALLMATQPNVASRAMVEEAMSQVRELHGPDMVIPDPYVAWYKDWTDDPFGGGYHAWKAGYSVKDVMPYMRKPLQDENVHVVGEAYSDQQGWVEGAFCVAERMLQDHFGMEAPEWLQKLDPPYYLGW